MATKRPHVLYRFWSDDMLLYVGITWDPLRRWAQHKSGQPWWFDVTHVTLERFGSRDDALDAETEAIKRERPRYNLAQSEDPSPEGLTMQQVIRTRGTLIGIYFLSDLGLRWFGRVHSEVTPGTFRVMPYDWGTGRRLALSIVRQSEMEKWRFYVSEFWMRRGFVTHYQTTDFDEATYEDWAAEWDDCA